MLHGIYPEYKDLYAIHMCYGHKEACDKTERCLNEHFDIEIVSKIPARRAAALTDAPIIRKYFVSPGKDKLLIESELQEDEYLVRCIGRCSHGLGKNTGGYE